MGWTAPTASVCHSTGREKLEACTVVTEACGAAHHWARILSRFGHEVKLIAPEAVRPFVKKGKKNDPADAATKPEVGQACLLIAFEAGNLNLRRRTSLQFGHQHHSP